MMSIDFAFKSSDFVLKIPSNSSCLTINSASVDLTSAGTDDQNLTSATIDTTTNVLTIDIENGDSVTVDLSYLISTTQQNPLANTLRFSLRLQFSELIDNSKADV